MDKIAALEAKIEQIPDALTVGAVIGLKQIMRELLAEFKGLAEVGSVKQ